MDDPIKIIFKYKNDHRRSQYHIYIFVGQISKQLRSILDKIKNLSLYETLNTLPIDDIKSLETMYGDMWYTKFFNTHHITAMFNLINKTVQYKSSIIDKFGDEWFKKHIEKFQAQNIKLVYNYGYLIKKEITQKELQKKKTFIIQEEEHIDYTTQKRQLSQSSYDVNTSSIITSSSPPQMGGDISKIKSNDTSQDILAGLVLIGGGYTQDTPPIEEDNNDEFEEGLDTDDVTPDEEIDIDEIEQLYDETNEDTNIEKTQALIKKVSNNEKILEKKIQNMIDFDNSKDRNVYDENLKDVFNKHYITDQYIFKDDTIKNIKDKICCSIKNNSKFGENAYIIPSRQYLWSEYIFNSKLEKIMIGHKWLKRNELLQIDIEPNENIKIYEELRGNLKNLKDDIKRYGSKIRPEIEDNNILFDYMDYITYNELYLIDVYNELGSEYKPNDVSLKNVTDTFIKLYFPKLRSDDVKQIIDFLNGNSKAELSKIQMIFETINNDLTIENEIMFAVEMVKKNQKYKNIFKDNYITQSVIHVSLRTTEDQDNIKKIDLFKIFNDFVPNTKYPFIQYLTNDGNIVFKFDDENIYKYVKDKNNLNILTKWFENAPYGISFKVKINNIEGEKPMAINLNELGRIEYKTQWKEEDGATIANITETYEYIKDLVYAINNTSIRTKFEIPQDYEFKYAFINTIQKFELPEKYVINHNDLSEFARYFYPYISLVIEPRKRLSKFKKIDDKSKYGTYLRYKRVSKYENQTRIEQRILYFMRNYEYTEQTLANEISKQFNITMEKALEDIQKTKNKYPHIKQSRKVLKKLENIPKYKPPGIDVGIQGKTKDKYKIRTSGVRDKDQLDRITHFMNIFIFLYAETYLYKKPEWQKLKDKLKNWTNIAKRRNKVDEIVNYSKDIKNVKQMAKLDKRRLGFKPEKGQSQWTRACQNSGTDKKRQPQQYTIENLDSLLKMGYKLNKTTGMYEKKITIKEKGKKKDVVLRTVYLRELDETTGAPTGNDIYYACSPDENGEHLYIGFLTRSKNPFGEYMPCCFKKDQYSSKNKAKKEFFLKCMGHIDTPSEPIPKSAGDTLYILQDTNKIQDGRFGFLPKYLDFYFNIMLNLQKKIHHHYLLLAEKGYFFKYGINSDSQYFLSAISMTTQITINDIIKKVINSLNADKNDMLFTALNNGDIKTRFETVDKYKKFIQDSTNLEFDMIQHIISMPHVLSPTGFNIVIFVRTSIVIKKSLEKEKIRENFHIICQNNEEVRNIFDQKKETIFLLKENKNYYPIFLVTKTNEETKDITITRTFSYENKKDNIINHISDYYIKSSQNIELNEIVNKPPILYAKKIYAILMSFKEQDYKPKYQYVDVRNKCRFIITSNGIIIPTHPSGSIYNLPSTKTIDKYVGSFNDTIDKLSLISSMNPELTVKPIGIYHDKLENNMAHVVAIMTQMYDIVPIIPENITVDTLTKNKFIIEDKPLYDKIDNEIAKGPTNIIIDDRIKQVNFDKFMNESYELFKFSFSEFINQTNHIGIKKKIMGIMNSSDNTKIKQNNIKSILYKIIDKELYNMHASLIGIQPLEDMEDIDDQISEPQVGGKIDKFAHIVESHADLSKYVVDNSRSMCQTRDTKEKCNISPHCYWWHSGCYLLLTKNMAITFVNKMSTELTSPNMKAFEILHIAEYYVSDIVDRSRFTERSGQTIVKSSSNTINSTLENIFGKENIPKIGKRRIMKQLNTDYNDIISMNPLKDMGTYYIQNIIPNNETLFRAYTNGFFWNKHKYYDIASRNLGYYSELQTETTTFIKSLIIDWLLDPKNTKHASNIFASHIDDKKIISDTIKTYIIKLIHDTLTMTSGIIELQILNAIHKIPIIVYEGEDVKYLFNDVFQDSGIDSRIINKLKTDAIELKFNFISNKIIPTTIDVIYQK